MKRRIGSLAALLATSALALAACGSGSSKAAVATSGTVPTSIPPGTVLHVADQYGAFSTQLALSGENKNYPYKVVYSNFTGGPPMLQAFQAGAVDIGYVAGTPTIFAQAAHQGVVAIGAYEFDHDSYVLAVAPGQNIKSWADLKGKTIAFSEGTVEESVVLQALQANGLKYSDIKPVYLSTPTALLQAVEGGKVDAAILVQPYTTAYKAKDPGAALIPGPANVNDRDSYIIASTSAISNPAKEAAIADFLSRVVKSSEYENTHQQQYAEAYYVKQFGLPLATAESIIAANGKSTWYDLPGPFLKPQQDLADLYAAAGEIPAKENVASEFTPLYNATVNAAVKAGGAPGASGS